MSTFARTVVLLATILTPQFARADEAADFPAGCRLTIGSEVYNVPVGKPFAVNIGGQRITMRLDARTSSEFNLEGIKFAYPTTLKASAPINEGGVSIWSFEGPSVALMLQGYDGELAPESLLGVLTDNIADQYGDDPIERQAVQLRGADRTYPGQQLRVSTNASGAGQDEANSSPVEIIQNVFAFASGKRVYALIVQDTRPRGADESAEYRESLRLLGETLKTTPGARQPMPANATSQRGASPPPRRPAPRGLPRRR